ncbi:MAG: type II toxin-antitoxin system PemK/MazF family toxin [Mycobacteriales bacterium]
MRRGEVVSHPVRDRRFVIVSCNALNNVGTVVVAEVSDTVPEGTRGMLAVPLTESDPVSGAVLAWRINYLAVQRLGDSLGQLSSQTLERVDVAIRAALEL